MNEFFPQLRPTSRKREYSRVSPPMRDKVLYEYLFNGLSHRQLDETILGLSATYTRGWVSMGVLHHLGLFDEHKGFFQGHTVLDAISLLTGQNNACVKPISIALLRYYNGLYSDESLELFAMNQDAPLLIKNVGTSQHTDGVRIEKEFHDIFNPPNSSYYTERGAAREIKVLFNNKVFNAEYRYEGQSDASVILQSIRFRKELKNEFKKVFPESTGKFSIQSGVDLNHFIFNRLSVAADEDEIEFSEYAEGHLAYKLHRIRERNYEVVRKAKEKFLKTHGRLYCQACHFDFNKTYGIRGDNFIEGHHTKLVSEMKEGEKTKVGDIALLCSNCHRVIHRKPVITVEKLSEIIKTNRDEF